MSTPELPTDTDASDTKEPVDKVRVITNLGTAHYDSVDVRTGGWVVCKKGDKLFHYPPHKVKQIKGPLSSRADEGVSYVGDSR